MTAARKDRVLVVKWWRRTRSETNQVGTQRRGILCNASRRHACNNSNSSQSSTKTAWRSAWQWSKRRTKTRYTLCDISRLLVFPVFPLVLYFSVWILFPLLSSFWLKIWTRPKFLSFSVIVSSGRWSPGAVAVTVYSRKGISKRTSIFFSLVGMGQGVLNGISGQVVLLKISALFST